MSPTPEVTKRARHAEFVELLRRHQHQLFSYVFALLRNQHDAEDLFQQASLVWWAKFDEFEPGSNFVAWACQIARYEVLNFYRRQNRSRALFSDTLQDELAALSADAAAELSAERVDALGHCIEKLSEPDRKLLDQVYGDGLSIRQVAGRRGRPVKSVYNSFGRIRKILEQCIRRSLARGGAS